MAGEWIGMSGELGQGMSGKIVLAGQRALIQPTLIE